jgi:hypothetical protein
MDVHTLKVVPKRIEPEKNATIKQILTVGPIFGKVGG